MIELYAITDDPGPALPPAAQLRVVACDGLCAVCADAVDREISADELWRHERVVEELMRDGDLLPVRYGTRLDDERAVVRALAARHAELVQALDRVRGAVELAVRALSNGEEVASGTEYLRARGRSAELHGPLSAVARMSVRTPGRVRGELLRAAYLVDRDQIVAFTDLVGQLQNANPDVQLLCTGPWPPYSFAE